ncbi:MAG: sugar ABC transporter substrate-binding protein [Deinococcota bacterium]
MKTLTSLLFMLVMVAFAQDDIVLQHWYHQYGEAGTFEAAVRYAEEYSALTPGVTVEVTWIPGDYPAALNAALLSNEGPDVFELQTIDLSRVRAGQLEPLDDLFEGVLDDFDATAMSRVTVDGTIYGVPMLLDPQFVYYNKAMFEAAGVSVPTTMDELIAAASALDTGRVKGLYLGNDLGSSNWLLYMTTNASGSSLLDGETVGFNTASNVEMWAKKKELADSGSLLVGATTEWWDPGALIDGLTAMQWSGLWAMPQLLDTLGEDVGVMPWPALNEDTSPSVHLGGWNQSVNASSAHVEAAKAYVKWLWIDNTEIQEDWNLSYGFHIPPRASTAQAAEALTSGPAAEVIELMTQYAKASPILWTGAMDSIYTDAHSQVLLRDADPAEALAAAAEAVQAELDSLLGR